MKRLRGFTLAEVLITLAIIGVVAAISIPSVISNSQQQEFKTGLRKAVSVLNSAITMNMAIDGESPYENADLFNYLQRHMAVMHTLKNIKERFYVYTDVGPLNNAAFYTTDGTRYEFRHWNNAWSNSTRFQLYESNVRACIGSTAPSLSNNDDACGGCGSYGLNNNTDGTTKPPCLIFVDVNGDRKPSPQNATCKEAECGKNNFYKYSDPLGLKLSDVYPILITDKQAIPYGVAAQRAMYQAQAKK